MATNNNDYIFVQGSSTATIDGLGGDDVFVISPYFVTEGQTVSISDTQGANTIQLVGGLTITSSIVEAEGLRLTLSNDAVITVFGANNFTYNVGGNDSAGIAGVDKDFTTFASENLGVVVPAAGEAAATGGEAEFNEDGTSTTPEADTYALTADAATVDEGASATFSLDTNLAEGTEVAYTISGDVDAADVDGGLTGTATVDADGDATITVGLVEDVSTDEGAETLTVTVDADPATTADVTVNDTSMTTTFTLTTDAAATPEGVAKVFTVEANQPVTEDTVVTFNVQAGDETAADQGTTLTNMNDFAGGTFAEQTATIAAGETTATFEVTGANDGITEYNETYSVSVDVAGETLTAEGTLTDGAGTYRLTTGVDEAPDFTGTDYDDTFKAQNDGTDDQWTPLDALDGGLGNDEFQFVTTADFNAIPGSTSLDNIEIMTVRASGEFFVDVADNTLVIGDELDFSSFTDLTAFNVTTGVDVGVKVADTTALNFSGVTGAIIADGGASQTVNTAGEAVTLGATTPTEGAISVTHTDQAAAIAIDGGSDVTVVATSDDTAGTITVGDTTAGNVAAYMPTGAITVTQNFEDDATAGDTAGAITVEGGTSIDITVNANSAAKTSADDNNLKVGIITATGYDNTTAVTITQNENITVETTDAAGGSTETASVQFGVLKEGDALTIDLNNNGTAEPATELTFVAAKDLTAAEVAEAFAGLTNLDTQDAGGPTANGYFTGALANWTSADASGDTVVFTHTTANTNFVTDFDTVLTNTSGSSTDAIVTITDGAAVTTAADTSLNKVAFGKVVVADDGTDSLTTVTIDGYAATSTLASDALTTLSLANSQDTAGSVVGTMDVTTAATTLDLTVNDVDGAVDLDKGSNNTLQTLTVNAIETASVMGLEVSGAETIKSMTINADVDLTITAGTTLDDALETVDINGAGAVDVSTNFAGAVKLNSFDASGNSGGVTATVEVDTDATLTGDLDEYVFSSGNDHVDLSDGNGTGIVDVKVTLGDGDDIVDLTTNIDNATAMIDGGAGTDTLGMEADEAEDATVASTLEANISNFEKLKLGNALAQETVDLDNLDDISYVIAGSADGTAQTDTVTLVQTAADTDDVLTVTVNGVAFTYNTVNGENVTNHATAMVSLINADTSLHVTASNVAGVLSVVSDFEGIPISVSSTFVNGAGTDNQSATAANLTPNAAGLTLNNMAAGGTLELTTDNANEAIDVNLTDATGTTDVFNVVTKVVAADLDFGALDLTDIETININADDTATTAVDTATLHLYANEVKTINVDGDSNLTLTLDNRTDELTLLDASDLTGALTATTNGTVSQTINGGSGADVLTAAGSQDILTGGAGADTLTGADLTSLTGGEGNDIFVINAPSNINAYSTVEDFTTGDKIDLANDSVFASSKIVLAGNATFTDYANATVKSIDDNAQDAAWFQFGDNTYIIQSGDAAADDFVNGTDSIIEIHGVVDLGTASYNQTVGTIECA